MSTITKEQLIEDLKASTQNSRGMFEIGEETICALMSLLTTPPAPVFVPEWTNKQCLEFLSIAFRHAEIKGDLQLDDIRLGVKMVNGSRAAMLQGADGNSPVIPDGWVILPAEPTQAMMNAWLSEVANWRGHAAGYRAMIAAAPQQEAE
ncbi:hypothetical protein [Enterobacter kobei]|uniref:hypothetical protein n=2 Tax=Enterobacter kobei TaxID=208224 RepID=UPI002074A24B|nr:hypothetical protein [Enterobacter kobei]